MVDNALAVLARRIVYKARTNPNGTTIKAEELIMCADIIGAVKKITGDKS